MYSREDMEKMSKGTGKGQEEEQESREGRNAEDKKKEKTPGGEFILPELPDFVERFKSGVSQMYNALVGFFGTDKDL